VLEHERCVLGSVLLEPGSIHRVSEFIRNGDFKAESHRLIWSEMIALTKKHEPVDLVTITFKDKKYLTELMECVPTADNIEHYAKQVVEQSQKIELERLAREILQQSEDESADLEDLLSLSEKGLLSVRRTTPDTSVSKIGDILVDVYKLIEERADGKGRPMGAPSGMPGLDQIIGGLSDTDLIIVAGRPAMGKSALAMGFAKQVAQSGKPAVVFSLEMSRDQLVMRMMAQEANLNAHLLAMGKLEPDEWQRVAGASSRLSEIPLYIDDSANMTMPKINGICRKFKHEHGGLGLIVVDYLQLLGTSNKEGNRENQVSEMSRSAKLMAKEMGCPVVLLSQLNRGCESRENKRPRPSDLRESGAIEQDADEIYFVYRDCVYSDRADHSEAEIIVAKNRDGPIGTVNCRFDESSVRFY